MSRNKIITDELAVEILDKAIQKCKDILMDLEKETEDYDNAFLELRMYQMHKATLLMKREGGRHDRHRNFRKKPAAL